MSRPRAETDDDQTEQPDAPPEADEPPAIATLITNTGDDDGAPTG